VGIDDGLLAFGAEEESAVAARVHEEIFYENGRRKGPSEKVEVGLQVGAALARRVNAVTVVEEDFHSWFCV